MWWGRETVAKGATVNQPTETLVLACRQRGVAAGQDPIRMDDTSAP